jgi:hypothetical protein
VLYDAFRRQLRLDLRRGLRPVGRLSGLCCCHEKHSALDLKRLLNGNEELALLDVREQG